MSQVLWRSLSPQDVYLSAEVSRFKLLREKGVSGDAIIAHDLCNRLAPLQKGLTRPGTTRIPKTLPACGTPTWSTPPFLRP